MYLIYERVQNSAAAGNLEAETVSQKQKIYRDEE